MIERFYKVWKIYFLSFFIFFVLIFLFDIFFNSLITVNFVKFIFLFSFLWSWYFIDRKLKTVLMSIVSLSIIFLIWYVLFYFIWDASIDWNTYHLQILFDLFNGHNIFLGESSSKWLNYYPKTIEILFGWFGSFFRNYDMWRILKLTVILLSFLNITYVIKKNVWKLTWWHFLITLLIVLNPVVLSQLFTFYIDDVLYLLLINFAVYVFLWDVKIWLIVFSLMVSAKLSYLCFWLISIVFLVLILSIYKKENVLKIIKDYYNLISEKWLVRILFVILIILVSWYQYLINTFKYHNPLYWFYWEWKTDIISMFEPPVMKDKNKILKFIYVYFSYSSNYCVSDDCQNFMKIDKWFLKNFYNSYSALLFPDPNLNWFWNLFSVLLLLSTVLLIFSCFKYKKIKNCKTIYGIMVLYVLFCTALLPFPWARYIPVLYCIPLLIILFLNTENKFFWKLILFIYAVNIVLILFFVWKTCFYRWIAKIKQQGFINNVWNVSEIYYTEEYEDSFMDSKFLLFYFDDFSWDIVKEDNIDYVTSLCWITSYSEILDSYNLILSCPNSWYMMLSDYWNSISDYFYIK